MSSNYRLERLDSVRRSSISRLRLQCAESAIEPLKPARDNALIFFRKPDRESESSIAPRVRRRFLFCDRDLRNASQVPRLHTPKCLIHAQPTPSLDNVKPRFGLACPSHTRISYHHPRDATCTQPNDHQTIRRPEHPFQLPPQPLQLPLVESAPEDRILKTGPMALQQLVRLPQSAWVADVVAHEIPKAILPHDLTSAASARTTLACPSIPSPGAGPPARSNGRKRGSIG